MVEEVESELGGVEGEVEIDASVLGFLAEVHHIEGVAKEYPSPSEIGPYAQVVLLGKGKPGGVVIAANGVVFQVTCGLEHSSIVVWYGLDVAGIDLVEGLDDALDEGGAGGVFRQRNRRERMGDAVWRLSEGVDER